MSALLQRARRGPGPLIVIVLVLNAAAVLAHDPGLSALEVSVSGNEIAATLSGRRRTWRRWRPRVITRRR